MNSNFTLKRVLQISLQDVETVERQRKLKAEDLLVTIVAVRLIAQEYQDTKNKQATGFSGCFCFITYHVRNLAKGPFAAKVSDMEAKEMLNSGIPYA